MIFSQLQKKNKKQKTISSDEALPKLLDLKFVFCLLNFSSLDSSDLWPGNGL